MLPKIYLLITSLAPIVSCHLLLKRHIDFRERFLERRRQREIKDQRIMILDKYMKDTESLDGILHYRMSEKKSKKWRKISDIENDFRRLIAMEGTKYNYKRDMFWRTWRKVISEDGDETLVCYKCNNPMVVNATGLQNCGMWTIEEVPPPCPYEFFYVIDDHKICGANYTQFNEIHNACPSVIPFSNIVASCDNPIETIWRFSKLYGASGEFQNVICEGKDYCEVSTIYEITPQHVTFRIINSSNDVMYSRIMKPNNTNYICIEDCGHFNTYTRKVTKNDRPLKLDLLSVETVKKEEVLNENVETESLIFGMHTVTVKETSTKKSMSKIGAKKRKKIKKKKSKLIKRQQNNLDFIKKPDKNSKISGSPCKRMDSDYRVSYEEQNKESYWY